MFCGLPNDMCKLVVDFRGYETDAEANEWFDTVLCHLKANMRVCDDWEDWECMFYYLNDTIPRQKQLYYKRHFTKIYGNFGRTRFKTRKT